MTEYFTESFVIDKKVNNESDGLVILYTKDLGRVTAKVKSIKKITSKLSGHLEPLNFVECRLIEKNGFQIIDALTLYNNSHLRKDELIYSQSLKLLQFVETMTFDLQPDTRFYAAIKKILEHFIDYKDKQKIIYFHLLKILGFDPTFALCAACHKKEIKFFEVNNHEFLCGNCISIADDLKYSADALLVEI
ncbi:MAG: DNA repair protein RecO [Patescibacteria group bacterium]